MANSDGTAGGGSSGPRLENALTYVNVADSKWGGRIADAFLALVSSIMLTVGAAIIAGIDSVGNFFTMLIDAFGLGGADWIEALTSDTADFVAQSFNTAARSIDTGPFAALGPFLPWLAAIVSIGVVAIVTWYLDQRNSDVPGLGINLPFIGNDSDGKED